MGSEMCIRDRSMVTTAVVWIALVLTVISLVDYITKNVNVLKEGKM